MTAAFETAAPPFGLPWVLDGQAAGTAQTVVDETPTFVRVLLPLWRWRYRRLVAPVLRPAR